MTEEHMNPDYRFKGESDPVASDPILRGVDLAMERLVQTDTFTERTLRILDALRAEVIASAPMEEAHAPTPDEREALDQIIEPYFDRAVDYNDGSRDDEGLRNEIIAAGFRLSVSPEPSGCVCYGADDVTDPKCPACRNRDPEPQAEPSDAQVIAAMNALNGYEPPVTDISYWSAGYVDAMRAALRAAAAVNERGENR